MYPYLRFLKVILKSSFSKKKEFYSAEADVINMIVMPQDLDPFLELNNGRYVTLLDLGRFGFGAKVRIQDFLKKNNWSMTITGTYNNYRYRLKLFQRFQIKTKVLGYDEKWFYFFQKAERKGKTHMASLVRFSFTSKKGLVLPEKVIEAMGEEYDPNKLGSWIADLSKHQLFKK